MNVHRHHPTGCNLWWFDLNVLCAYARINMHRFSSYTDYKSRQMAFCFFLIKFKLCKKWFPSDSQLMRRHCCCWAISCFLRLLIGCQVFPGFGVRRQQKDQQQTRPQKAAAVLLLTGILDLDSWVRLRVGLVDHLSADLFCQNLHREISKSY